MKNQADKIAEMEQRLANLNQNLQRRLKDMKDRKKEGDEEIISPGEIAERQLIADLTDKLKKLKAG